MISGAESPKFLLAMIVCHMKTLWDISLNLLPNTSKCDKLTFSYIKQVQLLKVLIGIRGTVL